MTDAEAGVKVGGAHPAADTQRGERLDDRRGGLPVGMGAAAIIVATFEDWLQQWEADPARWRAFDQFVREQLRVAVGGTRVRCHRLLGHELRALNPSGEPFTARLSAREGIAGYVIGRGHRYVRGDDLLGPIVHRLAASSPEEPVWCFPIVYEQEVLGLVTVGQVSAAAEQDVSLLESLGCVIALLWGRLVDRERMMLARQIDHGSGVLQRGHLFEAGDRALRDSYAEHEPVLAMVIALEGMRRLDDAGHWEGRDAAVERAGQAIRQKLRSDDVVGRFSDDRFVALMRRLDTSLGRMIAEKMVAAVRRELQKVGGDVAKLTVRCGLAGTGQRQPKLEKLLADAFAACDRARKTGVDLVDDLAPTPQEGGPPTGVSSGGARQTDERISEGGTG